MHPVTLALEGLTVGEPIAHDNLAMFPLFRPAPAASPGSAGDAGAAGVRDYLTLDEALAGRFVRITEVSDSGRVPELLLSNDAATRVLLLDGEELVGAKQNRVLNLTILVGAKQTLVIPVSCVEQGRWRYRTSEFRAADRTLFARARAEKMAQVTRSLKVSGMASSDQGAVWDSLALRAADVDVHSPTGAMADLYEQRGERLAAYRKALAAAPGQSGAVFAIDGEIVGLELFDAPEIYAKLHAKVLNGYALDAVASAGGRDARAASGAGGASSAGGASGAVGASDECAASRRDVTAFIARLTAAPRTEHEALGEGTDVRLESAAAIGGALVADGRVVHLSAFATQGANGRPRRHLHPAWGRVQ